MAQSSPSATSSSTTPQPQSLQATHRNPSEVSHDLFQKAAATYDTRMGGCTSAVAAHVVSLLSVYLHGRSTFPSSSHDGKDDGNNDGTKAPHGLTVLDNAAGTGALTAAWLAASDSTLSSRSGQNTHNLTTRICAVDVSPAMVSRLASRFSNSSSHGDGSLVETAVMDGQTLEYADETFDVSVTLFGIFFFADSGAGGREIYRTLKEGGRAVVTTWKEVGLLPLFYAAQAEVVRPEVVVERVDGLEDWRDVRRLRGALIDDGQREGFGERDVVVSEFETAIWAAGGEEELVDLLCMHFLSFAGGSWTEAEKGRVKEAAEFVVREREDLFVVDERTGRKGVRMVAWIAVCTRAG